MVLAEPVPFEFKSKCEQVKPIAQQLELVWNMQCEQGLATSFPMGLNCASLAWVASSSTQEFMPVVVSPSAEQASSTWQPGWGYWSWQQTSWMNMAVCVHHQTFIKSLSLHDRTELQSRVSSPLGHSQNKNIPHPEQGGYLLGRIKHYAISQILVITYLQQIPVHWPVSIHQYMGNQCNRHSP